MAADAPPADVVRLVRDAARAAGLAGAGGAVAFPGVGGAVALLSGGRDSVCLLDVAVAQLGAERVLAMHVNYGLREQAGGDEELCASLCARLGVALTVLAPQRPREAGGNLQAWARDVRYAEATRLALAHGACVLTGHTATDQVETILYRLVSSPGRRALLGMPRRRGLLLRPLLDVTREQTAAYCLAAGLQWREDATNETDEYARGRVRGGLVPSLRAIHPAAEANVLRTAELLRAEAAVLDEAVAEVLDGRDRIALEQLAALPVPLARLVLVRLAEDAAHEPVGGVGDRLGQLLALAGRGGTAELHVGGGLRALVEYGVLRLVLGPAEPRPAATPLPVPGRVRFGSWELWCEPSPEHEDGDRGDGDGDLAVLDADAVGESLLVRCWQAGDRIAPLGMEGSKTLSDLFVDRRVPRELRATVPLVAAGGTVAWVPGVAIDRRFALTPATRRRLALGARRS